MNRNTQDTLIIAFILAIGVTALVTTILLIEKVCR